MSVANIAARAGVSNATVSRVLNNSPRVNPETARLVREAAHQLQYTKMRRGPRIRGAQLQKKIHTFAILAITVPNEHGATAASTAISGVRDIPALDLARIATAVPIVGIVLYLS